MFTPFAFFQNAVVTPPLPVGPSGYFIGGLFSAYFQNNQPFFRVLTNSGSISSSFNQGTGFNSAVLTATTQSDGKLIMCGTFTIYSGSLYNRIIRLNPDGTVDTTFNIGSGSNGTVFTSVVQADGKVVIAGSFTGYSGSTKFFINRINPDGTSDTGSSWNQGTGFGNTVLSTVLQSDQKIIVGGNFNTYSGSSQNFITRINTDGTRDTTFNIGTGFDNSVIIVNIQSDGKILVGGSFASYSGSGAFTANRITRINTNGTRDTTFNIGTGFNSLVYTINTQSDGKILVGGAFTTYSGSNQNYITRINTDGTRDTTFNVGTGFDTNVLGIKVQSNGKILVTGTFSSYSGSIALGMIRLNNDGTIDNTFNRDFSIDTQTQGAPILELPNGSILLGGNFRNNRNAYADFLNINGGLTSSSLISTKGLNNGVYDILFQPSGKFIIVGDFTNYSGSTANRIVRLNSDLTQDTGSSWNTGVGFNQSARNIVSQSDGKLIVGGTFTNYSGSSINRIVRINTDGTRDTAFNVGVGVNGTNESIIIQPDGKIIAGGLFTTYSGSTVNRIVRINTDGTRDTTFNTGTGFFNNSVFKLNTQADEKIIAVGSFTAYSGSSSGGIVRINTNGTRDTTFNTGTGFVSTTNVLAAAIQPDQKIVAGGQFIGYSGSSANRITRINTNGTRDTTFNIGTGFNTSINTITIEPGTNKIVVGGPFTSYSGSTVNRIVRINTDGTIDNTFVVTGSGYNNTVLTIKPFDS
jgi:uncharacterized delta-60 repeat protein